MVRLLVQVFQHSALHGYLSAIDVFDASSFHNVDVLGRVTGTTAWDQHLADINNPRYRYLALYLRAPLFFNEALDPAQRTGMQQWMVHRVR